MTSHKVYFSNCVSYADPDLDAALKNVLADFNFNGKRVLLKPNWLSWRKDNDPASVHPRLLIATVRYLRNNGATAIAVRENPGTQDTTAIAGMMGILHELSEMGVEVMPFQNYDSVQTPEGCSYHKLELSSDYKNFDILLNLAKAKTHGMMLVTLAVKNLFGLVRGTDRIAWHFAIGKSYSRFADMLLDLYLTVKPSVNLLDAVICMEGNGPGNGSPVAGNFLAASADALALDAAICKNVFRIPFEQIPVMNCAAQRHLIPETECIGPLPQPMSLVLPSINEDNSPFLKAIPGFLQNILRENVLNAPQLDPQRCIGCGLCVKVCPPKSLKLGQGRPVFHLKTCIRCYCCQEMCPKNAIKVRGRL